MFYFSFLLILLQGCNEAKVDGINSIDDANRIILHEEGPEQFLYWEFKDQSGLWDDELGEVVDLMKYRDSLNFALGNQSFISAVNKESEVNLNRSLLANEKNGDEINALLIHTGSIGSVREISFLESQILDYQTSRFPMFSKPTEFHVFIVEHEINGFIRVYFGSSNTEWPPHPVVLLRDVEKLTNNGWKLIRHLHNHYCKKEDDYIGILAPSLADAQYYKMLKERFNLDVALITNGFHTVEIKSSDFVKFEAHGD